MKRIWTACGTLVLSLVLAACGGAGSDPEPPPPVINRTLVQGMDLSFAPEMSDRGLLFYEGEQAAPAISILQRHGSNLVRLRLWVNPQQPYNTLSQVAAMARQAQALGMQWMLDLHFSDTWADPANQTPPLAWQDMDYATLVPVIEAYTENVMRTLDGQGVPPQYVQIGNEIGCGMLWPMAHVCGSDNTPLQWQRLAGLIAAAQRGLERGTPASLTHIIHIDSGGDNAKSRWFFDRLSAENVRFDMIGLSYYPWWHGSLQDLAGNMNDLAARYQKPVMVVETAYPWTLDYADARHNVVGEPAQLLPGYAASAAGQAKFMQDVRQVVLEVPDQRGAGVIYWAPDWRANDGDGSSYENLGLFDFDGQLLPAAASWKNP